jgi:outer membrane protein TolC
MTRIRIPLLPIVLVLLVLIAPAARSQAQAEQLTLSQAVTLALEQNSQVLQARESIAGSTAKVSESRSAEYPLVNVSASYARVGPIASYTVAIGPMFPPITMKFGVENTYSAGVNIQHSLFNWGRTQAGIDISEAGLRLSESSLELARQSVAYQVIQTFYGILVSHEAVDVLSQSITSLESRLKTVRSRFDAGLASNFDVLTIEVQIANVRSRKVDTESNLRRLELLFNRFTGRPINSPVSLKGDLLYHSFATDPARLFQTATEKRRELEQLKHQETLAFAQMKLTNSLDKPNVNLSLTWGLRNGYMPNLDVLRGNWNAGVVLVYPLFDGFKTRNQLDQADVNIHLAQMRYEDVRNAVSMEVNQSLVDLQANEEKIRIEELKVRQAEEALKIADERYAKGLLSTIDLLDSQTSLESARLNLLQATYSAIISKYNLDKAVGVVPF